jgi:nucleoside-diphosphate-sugar epimerase
MQAEDEDEDPTPRVLVMGGNGFIGAYTVEALLDAGYRVAVLNRNSSYFDSRERVLNRVQVIVWDRERPLADCMELEVSDLAGDVHCCVVEA